MIIVFLGLMVAVIIIMMLMSDEPSSDSNRGTIFGDRTETNESKENTDDEAQTDKKG